jgi:hypothetical protein
MEQISRDKMKMTTEDAHEGQLLCNRMIQLLQGSGASALVALSAAIGTVGSVIGSTAEDEEMRDALVENSLPHLRSMTKVIWEKRVAEEQRQKEEAEDGDDQSEP